jgi:guanine deaminase
MKIAYDEAVIGMLANEGGPFGAVIIKDEKVIATAHNEVLKSKDPTAHAELSVIRKASQKLGSFDLSETVLYTTCMPCPMCLGAIFWARIKTVYYGATEDDAARAGFDDKVFYEMIEGKKTNITMKQIDHKPNSELFEQFLQKGDRQLY